MKNAREREREKASERESQVILMSNTESVIIKLTLGLKVEVFNFTF